MMTISVEPGRSVSGRRRFSIEYRLEFLRRWDEASVERGARARLLRENGLDRNTVRRWTEARRRGELEVSMDRAARVTGRVSASVDRAELARLRVENEKLRRRVAEAQAAQEILGKAFELLEGITTSSHPDPEIPLALMSATEYADWLKEYKIS